MAKEAACEDLAVNKMSSSSAVTGSSALAIPLIIFFLPVNMKHLMMGMFKALTHDCDVTCLS